MHYNNDYHDYYYDYYYYCCYFKKNDNKLKNSAKNKILIQFVFMIRFSHHKDYAHYFYELGLSMELDSSAEVKTTTTSKNDISSSSPSTSITKSFTVPIVFGNLAVALKKPENEHTHRWTVFVRGFNNEDISTFVRKVIFKLHDSFLQPNRGKHVHI